MDSWNDDVLILEDDTIMECQLLSEIPKLPDVYRVMALPLYNVAILTE